MPPTLLVPEEANDPTAWKVAAIFQQHFCE